MKRKLIEELILGKIWENITDEDTIIERWTQYVQEIAEYSNDTTEEEE